MARRQINRAGLDIVKLNEGLKLVSYLCPARVWTVGYGSTGPHVKPGMKITRDEAESLLLNDLRRFEEGVAELCPETTDNQFSALVSFAFNCGLAALKGSTLRKLHNAKDYAGAAGQFGRWSKGGGKVLRGLIKRRAQEAALYSQA